MWYTDLVLATLARFRNSITGYYQLSDFHDFGIKLLGRRCLALIQAWLEAEMHKKG